MFIGLLIKIVLGAVVVGGVAVAGGAVLTFTGTPTPCADRVVFTSSTASASLQSKWDAFRAEASAGPATVVFTEEEATSRAIDFLGGNVEDFQVLFCSEGYAEAIGTAGGVDFLVRGDLNLSGPQPEIEILKVEVGSLPGFIPVEGAASNLLSQLEEIEIDVNITSIAYASPNPNEVQITGAP